MILIVGGHPDYQDRMPDHDERWVMGKSFDRVADRVFEIHGREKWSTRIEHLNSFDCPIYMQDHYPEIPDSIAYPLTEMQATFGRFQTCSMAYMLALAIREGRDVAIWGAGGDTEAYHYQTPNYAFLAGYARAKGQRVIAHPDSVLQRILHPPYRYGWDCDTAAF